MSLYFWSQILHVWWINGIRPSPLNNSLCSFVIETKVFQTVEKLLWWRGGGLKPQTCSYILNIRRENIHHLVLTIGLAGNEGRAVLGERVKRRSRCVCAACLAVLVVSGRGHTCSASLRTAYAKQTYRSYISTVSTSVRY